MWPRVVVLCFPPALPLFRLPAWLPKVGNLHSRGVWFGSPIDAWMCLSLISESKSSLQLIPGARLQRARGCLLMLFETDALSFLSFQNSGWNMRGGDKGLGGNLWAGGGSLLLQSYHPGAAASVAGATSVKQEVPLLPVVEKKVCVC